MSLTAWNGVAAAAHAILALWSTTLPNKSIQLYKFAFDTSVPQPNDIDYPQKLDPGITVNLKPFVILFFAITSLAHVWYALDVGGKYSYQVQGFGWNPYRWFEYSITASLMIFVISIVAGAKELSTALVATLITPGLMFQGFTTEREIHQNALAAGKKTGTDSSILWGNFIPAWAFFALKWYIIFNAYATLKSDLGAAGITLQASITQLVFIQFVAFSLFGVVQSIQVYGWARPSAPRYWRFETYEKMYIALSFVAKIALGLSVANLLN